MATQTEIPGVSERTPLGKAAHAFLEQKRAIEAENKTLEEKAQGVLAAMEKENRQVFKVSDGGVTYGFKIVEAEKKLSCTKIKEPRR